LNGDGVCELYIVSDHASGTGGYAEGIFRKNGDTYELIAKLFGFDLRLAEKRNGYLQFIYHEVIYTKEGGKTYRSVLYQFNGKEYIKINTPD
jgi:hypothetical protein